MSVPVVNEASASGIDSPIPSSLIPDTVLLEQHLVSMHKSARVRTCAAIIFHPLSAPKKMAQMKIAVSQSFTFHRVKLVFVRVCFILLESLLCSVTDLQQCF